MNQFWFKFAQVIHGARTWNVTHSVIAQTNTFTYTLWHTRVHSRHIKSLLCQILMYTSWHTHVHSWHSHCSVEWIHAHSMTHSCTPTHTCTLCDTLVYTRDTLSHCSVKYSCTLSDTLMYTHDTVTALSNEFTHTLWHTHVHSDTYVYTLWHTRVHSWHTQSLLCRSFFQLVSTLAGWQDPGRWRYFEVGGLWSSDGGCETHLHGLWHSDLRRAGNTLSHRSATAVHLPITAVDFTFMLVTDQCQTCKWED